MKDKQVSAKENERMISVDSETRDRLKELSKKEFRTIKGTVAMLLYFYLKEKKEKE